MEGPKISGHVNGIKQSSKPCNSSSAVKRYQAWWPFPDGATGSEADEARRNREQNTNQVAIDYYEVVTSSYERGWGQHFHYCPMIPGKSIEESITEYEVLVGKLTSLKADMKVLDIGCGVCGPARTIAKSFGCEIVGLVNSNRLVKRGTTLNEEAGLTHLISIVEGDFHVSVQSAQNPCGMKLSDSEALAFCRRHIRCSICLRIDVLCSGLEDSFP